MKQKTSVQRKQSREILPQPYSQTFPVQPVGSMSKPQIILVGLLVIASFLIGSLYTKVSYLQSGGGTAAGAGVGPAAGVPKSKYKTFDDAMKAMAKIAKADGNKIVKCMNDGEKKSIVDADAKQGATLGVNGTPAFFINGRFISGAMPIEEFKKVFDEELNGTADKAIERKSVDLGNAQTKGPKDAKITFVAYTDFQCPFCARVYPTITQLMKDYDGKVQLVLKHFPLISIHPRAQKASEATECARDQGKFWEFHDALFENQQDWSSV